MPEKNLLLQRSKPFDSFDLMIRQISRLLHNQIILHPVQLESQNTVNLARLYHCNAAVNCHQLSLFQSQDD